MSVTSWVRGLQKRAKKQPRQTAMIAVALVFGTVGTLLLTASHALTPTANIEAENGTISGSASVVTASGASGGQAVKFGTTTTCTVSTLLVNSCRPWLGASAGWYTSGGTTLGNWKSEVLAHETRIGRQVDVAHDYSGPGDTLSSDEKYFINRANTYLMLNFKPVTGGTAGHHWSDATGCGTAACDAIDANIDTMANSIKTVAPKKLFLTLWAEPDNDIVPGGSPGCVAANSSTSGAMGTTADYVAMWHNVRARFDADGVTNVVWSMNYMGYAGHNCSVNDLWPGNSYVDWIVWDPYMGSNKTLDQTGVGLFYSFLTSNTNGTRAYTCKPWGLNEWGTEVVGNPSATYTMYGRMKTALDNNTYPNLKMFNVWDSHTPPGTNNTGYELNWQIGYAQTDNNVPPSTTADPNEQAAYNAFANDPRFTDAFYQ